MNERGFTLPELLVWLTIMSMIAVVGTHFMNLQVSTKNMTDVAKFYDEVTLIDKYIARVTSTETDVSYTETELEVTSATEVFRLSKGKDKISVTLTDSGTGHTQTTYLTYIKTFKISELNTLVIKGERSGSEYIYRVPIKDTLQIFYNPEPMKYNWFKEVVTYAF